MNYPLPTIFAKDTLPAAARYICIPEYSTRQYIIIFDAKIGHSLIGNSLWPKNANQLPSWRLMVLIALAGIVSIWVAYLIYKKYKRRA